MDFWDKPFSPSTFHDFPELFIDGKVTVDSTVQTVDTTDDDSSISSVGSVEVTTNAAPTIRHVSATTRVDFNTSGDLIDTGGNFCMTNDLNVLVNVQRIAPFAISMAATQNKSDSQCTH
jgi:hypothetical protein